MCEVSIQGVESTRIKRLRERFAAQDQEHVFQFWDDLDAASRKQLLEQAEAIDLPGLLRGFEAALRAQDGSRRLEPVRVEALPESGGNSIQWQTALERGEALLADGRVAVMVVAGGQGTRLACDGPKGAYPLGPITGRTLFEQQAQKIRRLRRRCGQPVPWYVMTSNATDAATRDCFARAGHFGLPPEDIFFLCQGMVPSLDLAGKLILAAPDRIFENPNGHGGSLLALQDSGALDDMARRGIDTIFYYQVDNPLTRIGSPTFLGFHAQAAAQVSCKVLRKRDPAEHVGVVARVDGRVGVVEYTEIGDADRNARDASGELVYWAGNMAVHVFSSDFVRHVAARAESVLPYHVSLKKIPRLDERGRKRIPDAPNAYKLERFVFDALAAAERVCVVEARRSEEYAPLKNATGADSPATARRELSAQYRAWLEAAGVEPPPPACIIEIDQSVLDGPEDVRALGIRRVEDAAEIIRTAPGDEA